MYQTSKRLRGFVLFKGAYDKRRMWELLTLNNITFSFWLATASFAFFAYQSLLPEKLVGFMNWTRGVLSAAFMIFGLICVATIIYLIVTAFFGVRVVRKPAAYDIHELDKMLAMRKRKIEILQQLKEEVERNKSEIDRMGA